MMQASAVYCRNPFAPGRERAVLPLRRRIRVSTACRQLAVDLSRPTLCLYNGEALMRADWKRRTIKDGDVVAFVALPEGGGDSNPLAVVAMIALMVVAPYAAPMLAGAIGVTSAAGIAALQAGIMMAGSALISAVLPPPRPPSPSIAANMAAPSPTYNLGAQGNQARLGQAIPEVFGRHLVYPDFGAQPYAEYAGNEQYLYQLFCIGQGYYDIEAIRIEDTPIASFEEITYEVVPPAGTVTLFPADVVTSGEVSGQEAIYNTTLGPFVANAAGSQINAIAVDVVCPKGLFYANDDASLGNKTVQWTVEARAIDDDGLPVGAWGAIGTESLTAASNTPQRRSYRYDIADGRYEVKLTRTNAKDETTRAGHDLNWVGLRGYVPGTQQYGNVTMLAMRMRATNNLSAQASRKVNLIVTRKLPTWSPGGGWTANTATRAIAWAAAYACRAAAGGNVPDSRINLAQLYAIDQTLAARGDYFDMVFDSTLDFWEALTIMLRAGRAKPYMQGGIVHAWRDQAQTLRRWSSSTPIPGPGTA